jgi:hypothetical protein
MDKMIIMTDEDFKALLDKQVKATLASMLYAFADIEPESNKKDCLRYVAAKLQENFRIIRESKLNIKKKKSTDDNNSRKDSEQEQQL